MNWWQTADTAVFYWINSGCSNQAFDWILPLFREKWFWTPAYLFLTVFVIQNLSSKQATLFLLGLVIAAGLSDFTSSTLIKKNVQRTRPCNEPELEGLVIERVPCGSGYSFTSSHAANHFAAATYVGLVFGYLAPWLRPLLFLWAFLIAFAQVYVGVHYPGDILAGGCLGGGIGWGSYRLFHRFFENIRAK